MAMHRCQIVQRICRALFVKEKDIVIYFFFYGLITGNMKIHNKFSFYPTVNGFHGCVVS